MNRVVVFAACVSFVVGTGAAGSAGAQELFPRFDFHLDGHYVVSTDPRFNWIFDFGGDIDIVRGDAARATFLANYEAIAGDQFRRFDVNQGNYLLEGAFLFRLWGLEIGPVWHHVSRHLSDRAKRFPIDWNMIAVRVRDDHTLGRVDLSWRADARSTVTSAFVDYQWEVEAAGAAGVRLTPRLILGCSGTWRVTGTDGTRDRGTQVEGKIETLFRVEGRAAAAEVFAGVERRLDPYPGQFGTASWFLAGLRLTSR